MRYWKASVIRDGQQVSIRREFGVVGGKPIINIKQVLMAKSQKSIFDQAMFTARKEWSDMVEKKGYVEDQTKLSSASSQLGKTQPAPLAQPAVPAGPEKSAAAPAMTAAASEAPGRFKFLPMLANKFEDRKKNVKYPCICQPKIDGVRYSAHVTPEGKVELRSRRDSPCPFFDDIKAAVAKLNLPPGIILDGEFYSRRIPFRTLNGHCNRKKMDGPHGFATIPPADLASIHYFLFDCYFINEPKKPFIDRHGTLTVLLSDAVEPSPLLELVPNFVANSEADVRRLHDELVAEGYEGVMVRNPASLYKLKDRSNDLLKLKAFQDAEFEIVGAECPATGKEVGCIIWVLKTPPPPNAPPDVEAKTFTCRPRDTYETRKEDWQAYCRDPKAFVGKMYTVRFQETYEDGTPRFPAGVGLRYDLGDER